MPGINFIISLDGDLKSLRSKIVQGQNLMKHNQDYYESVLFAEERYFLGYVKYEEYPIEIFENSDYFILLEGKIYNKNSNTLKNELIQIAKVISLGRKQISDILENWILGIDGDYIILILDREKK